jgi:hypothetical protein
MRLEDLRDAVRWYSKEFGMSDAELDRCIEMARKRLGLGLRTMQNTYVDNAFPVDGGPVPDGFREARTLTYGGVQIYQISPVQAAAIRGTGGAARYYTIQAGRIVLGAAQEDVGTLVYYGDPAVLVEGVEGNGVLEAYPQLWTQAALVEAFQGQQNDAARQLALGQYQAELEDANRVARVADWGRVIVAGRG